ncbi:hypothetical protein V2J09_011869 [Rumex salicifolius]
MPLLVTKMGNCVMVLARWRIAVSLPVTTLTEKESANTFEREKERIQINSGNRWMEGGASRDGFSFYGSGKMVACFRYVSIDVHSVFLPPFKFDFSHEIQDWIKKDADEAVHMGVKYVDSSSKQESCLVCLDHGSQKHEEERQRINE